MAADQGEAGWHETSAVQTLNIIHLALNLLRNLPKIKPTDIEIKKINSKVFIFLGKNK